jgi:very-short-patch-repair endonuclease
MRHLDPVRALVADAVRMRLCTPEELQIEVDAGQRNGSAHLRAAVEEVSDGAWSVPEARVGRLLRRAGLGPFVQNARIALPGNVVLTVDVLWPHLRAVLEIDSDEFHDLPPDADRTDERHLLLTTHGYTVVHRRPAFIYRRPEAFTRGIATWLAARARELGLEH